MTVFKRFICISILFIGCIYYAGAEETTRVNTLDKEKWEKISSGLDYTEKEPEKKKEEQAPAKEVAAKPSKGWDLSFLAPLKIVAFIAIIALIAYIIARLLPAFINRNRTVKNDIRIDVDQDENLQEENIAEWPLQKLLTKYIQEGDIRNAVRIYYLMSLQLLHLNGFIAWKKDKTNSHYVMEFSAHARAQDFSILTQIYETTWYGQFTPDENMFAVAKSQFTTFNTQFPMPA